MSRHDIHRREILASMLGAGALTMLPRSPFASFFEPAIASAQLAGPAKKFVLCQFQGAWDVLLGPDFRPGAHGGITYGDDIDPALRVGTRFFRNVTGALGGETRLGPTMAALAAHDDHMTVFRGLDMKTVAHDVGTRYANTFKTPAGSTVRGSSLGTVFAAAGLGAADVVLPFVSIGPSTYLDPSRDPSAASGIRLARPTDLAPFFARRAQAFALPDELESLVDEVRQEAGSCVSPTYGGLQPADAQRVAIERSRRIAMENYESTFASFSNTPMDAARAAGQLIKLGIARSVAVKIQGDLDTHTSGEDHGPLLTAGFNAVAALLEILREDDPDLEHTTVVCISEFARHPQANTAGGRNHWFASSAVVFGGLRPGVFGATDADTLNLTPVDPTNGTAANAGISLAPEHVAATMAAAAGLDPSRYNEAPIAALLRP